MAASSPSPPQTVTLDTPPTGYDQVIEGDYVRITVRDQGSGIAAEDQDRIFEPFFSKKNIGQSGTGLGMTVVWGTVEDHLGYITLSSEENQGTEFCLYFPATREEEQGANQRRLGTLSWSGRTFTGSRRF